MRGRGAASNPTNRFERLEYVPDEEAEAEGERKTVFLRDPSRSIIARNDSPDVGFETSVNPYRGCEHGCAYCFARPTHEYLGFSAGLDFESRIMVKEEAPALLRDELASPGWTPKPIAISGVTDPYQPIERRLQLTRRCLEVLTAARNPVVIITKNALVTRDCDLLAELASVGAAAVCISITTLDDSLVARMEPRTSRPSLRLDAVERLASAGVPVGILVAPVIPSLNDHEIPAILEEAASRGAGFASYVLLRLPWTVAPIFEEWLQLHYPNRSSKVLNKIRSTRGGKLYDSAWGKRGRGEGQFAEQIRTLFDVARKTNRLDVKAPPLSTESFRRPVTDQFRLF